MARLLLVTRSMALSLRLADAHDVVERPDDDLDTLTPDPGIDLVVLDAQDPQTAVETVRARDIHTPVLVVSGYQPEWAALLSASLPNAAVVALPITRASLLEGIERLLNPGTASRSPVPVSVPPVPVPPPELAPEPEPEPPTPATSPVPVIAPTSRSNAPPPEPDLVLGEDYDPFFATAPHGLDDLQPDPTMRRADASLVELVHQLIERAAELYGVPDTAQVLADEIVERADADAAAVLIPDGAVWRVTAGVGLRPLERRLVLDSSHWLIAEAALQGRALLIEDTDIVRQKIAGAPLAAWRHLMCLPVVDLRSAVVVARSAEAGPFTERDLAAVIDPIREASGLLHRALDVRRLARLLAPLRDLDDRRGR
jgi:hypothetical protein